MPTPCFYEDGFIYYGNKVKNKETLLLLIIFEKYLIPRYDQETTNVVILLHFANLFSCYF